MYISIGDLQRAGLSGPITDEERAWEQLWKEAKTDEQRRVLAEHHARTRAVRDPNAVSNEQIAKAIADQKALRERLAAQPKTQVEASPHTASQYAMSERQRQIDIEIRTANNWINFLEARQRNMTLTKAEADKLANMRERASAASKAAMELRSAMDRTDRPQTGISLEAGSSRSGLEVGFTAPRGSQPLPAKSATDVSSYWEKIEDNTPYYNPEPVEGSYFPSLFAQSQKTLPEPKLPSVFSRPTPPAPQWDFSGTLTTASRPDPYAASRERLEKIRKESEARTAAIREESKRKAEAAADAARWSADKARWNSYSAQNVDDIAARAPARPITQPGFVAPVQPDAFTTFARFGPTAPILLQEQLFSNTVRPTTQGPPKQMISPPAVQVFPPVVEDVFSQIENKTAYGFPMQMTPSSPSQTYTPLQSSQQPQQARPVTQATAYGTPGASRLPAPGLPGYLYRPQ